MKPNKAYCGQKWTAEETLSLAKAWCETGSWIEVAKRVSLISPRTQAMCRNRWTRVVQRETRRAATAAAAGTTVTKPSVLKRAIDGASADCRMSDGGTYGGMSGTHNVLKEKLDGSLGGMADDAAPRPAHDLSLLECDYFDRFWKNRIVDSLGLKPESVRFPPGVVRRKRVGFIDPIHAIRLGVRL
jgi:hypothetical protein